jgi:hypothetical protein
LVKIAAPYVAAGRHVPDELKNSVEVMLGERSDLRLRQRHRDSLGRIVIGLREPLMLDDPDVRMIHQKRRGLRERLYAVRLGSCRGWGVRYRAVMGMLAHMISRVMGVVITLKAKGLQLLVLLLMGQNWLLLKNES